MGTNPPKPPGDRNRWQVVGILAALDDGAVAHLRVRVAGPLRERIMAEVVKAGIKVEVFK